MRCRTLVRPVAFVLLIHSGASTQLWSFLFFSFGNSCYQLWCTIGTVSVQRPGEHVKNALQNIMTEPNVMYLLIDSDEVSPDITILWKWDGYACLGYAQLIPCANNIILYLRSMKWRTASAVRLLAGGWRAHSGSRLLKGVIRLRHD